MAKFEEELGKIFTEEEIEKLEQVKKLVGSNFVPTSRLTEEKEKLKGELATIAEEKNSILSEYEEFKKSKMTDTEKETQKILQQEKELKETKTLLGKLEASAIFADAGFKKEDYEGLLDTIVQTDPAKTKSFAQQLVQNLVKQQEDITNKVKEEIIKGTTKPEGGEGGSGTTTNIEMYQTKLKEAQESKDMVNIAYYTRLIQQENNKKN